MTNDWAEVDLGSLVEILDHQRKPLSKIERAERTGPFPYYGASGVIDHIDDYLFEERLLLVAEDGENLNSRKLPVAFIAEGKYWVNNHAHVLRARPGLADLDYLAVTLRHHPLNGAITGAAQPKLTQANLRRLRVRIPAYGVQVMTGHLARMFDDLIENNWRRIELLEEAVWLLYQEWFVHFLYPGHEDVPLVDSELGPIPQGWEVKLLRELADYINRGITPQYDDTSPARVLNQRCIRDQRISLDKVRYQSKTVVEDKLVRVGDVLVNSTGVGTLGRVAQVVAPLDDTTVDSHVTIVRPGVALEHGFFGQAMKESQARLESMGVGSTGQTELSRSSIGEIQLVLPPPQLQKDFQLVAGQLIQLSQVLHQSAEVLIQTRDLLLPRLVSGDLDISDLDLDLEAVS